ncbi:MAG: hypothetical protein JXA09_08035 [Anaerolineae bacterium]|nr:hypothetical protein [Anaerolineae bacterium]
MRKLSLGLACLLGGLVFTGIVLAQVSSNYDLSWHLLSGGGGSRGSTNYQIDDALGQWVAGSSQSASYAIGSGFWAASLESPCTVPLLGVTIAGPTSGYTDTSYSFVGTIDPADATSPVLYTWTPEPVSGQGTLGAVYSWSAAGEYTLQLNARNCGGSYTATHVIDISATEPVEGDAYEVDDTCGEASQILTDGTPQYHNFHVPADRDWIKFTAKAQTTYVIETSEVGVDHDAVVYLYGACEAPSLDSDDNSFGQTVHIEWYSASAGTYYLMLQQYDPEVYGENTGYAITVEEDTTPPSTPKNPRSAPADGALILQWKRSPEPDVAGYEVCYNTSGSGCNGIMDVEGADTTYYQLGGTGDLDPLNNGWTYYVRILSKDLSGNRSQWTAFIDNVPNPPPDATEPTVTVSQPGAGGTFTTTLGSTSVSGDAQDVSGNLSRVKVRNATTGVEKWDYSLSGSSAAYHVTGLGLNPGSNLIQVTAYDDAGNAGDTSLSVTYLSQPASGAVIIVAGRNASWGLQSNIYNATNRAYRIFQGAGYPDDAIYYLAPASQAPYGDGVNKVDATASAANVQTAITDWAVNSGLVGPDDPLHIYMMDHGVIEGFCTTGCSSSDQTPADSLGSWLSALESATGVTEVNVIIEACHSGSFIDRVDDINASLSKAGRVVISSTGRNNNAYASAEGAYFSDAFFSCVVGSGSLKTCYDQGAAAVALMGVDQTPWLDDNGDGLSNASDGAFAQERYIATSFGSFAPTIMAAAVELDGATGSLDATVERGAEEIKSVWAAVYAPSFQEPEPGTPNLGVPVVLLQPDPADDTRYTAVYPNGFTEQGEYRVVFYAQDEAGTHAPPVLVVPGGAESRVFLPLLLRNSP